MASINTNTHVEDSTSTSGDDTSVTPTEDETSVSAPAVQRKENAHLKKIQCRGGWVESNYEVARYTSVYLSIFFTISIASCDLCRPENN